MRAIGEMQKKNNPNIIIIYLISKEDNGSFQQTTLNISKLWIFQIVNAFFISWRLFQYFF